MAVAIPTNHAAPLNPVHWLVWAAPLAGLALLYVPTYIDLYRQFWAVGASGAPVMLLLTCWLFWRQRDALRTGTRPADGRRLGIALVACGCVLYYLGRTQTFYQLEVVSQVPLILGSVTVICGMSGFRRVLFPALLLLFLVPVPGSVLDEVLMPLKEWVSDVVDAGLHLAGYPIGRTGVIITIGPYNLLVADACSGLHSIIALFGTGLIYAYLSSSSSPVTKGLLLLSIIPVALLTNVLRVAGLTLITFYFGEEAGAEFHDMAGYLEVVLAFAALYAIERVLLRFQARGGPA
jgi:exosortase